VHYEGDAEAFRSAFAAWVHGSAAVVVPHFSGVGLDFGTTEDLNALLRELPPSSDTVPFTDEMLSLFADPPIDEAALTDLVDRWLTDVLLPEIGAAGDDSELTAAVADYGTLTVALDLGGMRDLVETELGTDYDDVRAAFVPKLQAAVERNNELCLDGHGSSRSRTCSSGKCRRRSWASTPRRTGSTRTR
jgi:hypothetical protein